MTSLALLMTTVSSEADAETLSKGMLQARLAACVTTIPGVQSRYWWKDQLESSTEWLLLIKTSPDRVDSLKRHLSEHHPYDTPELLEVPVTSAFTAYAAWVEKETRP